MGMDCCEVRMLEVSSSHQHVFVFYFPVRVVVIGRGAYENGWGVCRALATTHRSTGA